MKKLIATIIALLIYAGAAFAQPYHVIVEHRREARTDNERMDRILEDSLLYDDDRVDRNNEMLFQLMLKAMELEQQRRDRQ